MTVELRTLPIRLAPLPGEALDSWLETLADRNMVDFREIVIALGLHRRHAGGGIPDYTVFLRPEEAEQAASASGVPVERLHAMTLRQYDGHAVLLHPDRRSVNRMKLWGRSGSRYCPECLREEGRWQLRWRLPWVFACVRHQLLLAHDCPSCGQRTRHGRVSLFRAIQPHQCSTRLERGGLFCRADLTQTSVISITENTPVLTAQKWINDLLFHAENAQPYGSPELRTAFRDLRALAAWTLRANLPGDFESFGQQIEQACQDYAGDGQFSPASAAVTAGSLTRAVHFLEHGASQENILAIRELLDRDRDRLELRPPDAVNRRWRDHSQGLQQLVWTAMDPRLDTTERLRYRTCTSRPRPPKKDDPRIAARAARIPQLLWRGWTARLLPATGIRRLEKFRATLAVALLLPGWSKRRFGPLINMLHEEGQPDLQYLLAELAQQGHDSVFAALCEIAEYLDTQPVPIDYERRRRLVGIDLLPAEAWTNICAETGILPGYDNRLLTIRRYLFQRITGNDLQQAPLPLRVETRVEAAALAVIPFRITAPLLHALDAYATGYLNGLGIDEPLTWEPPGHLAAGLSLPGRPVDVDQAHRLICNDEAPSAAAKRMGVTLESLRHCFEEHPPDAPWPSNGRGSWFQPNKPSAPRSRLAAAKARQRARTLLTDDFLRHEYARKSIKTIAAETALPTTLISARLKQMDLLTSRKPSRAKPVDEQWLREQYIRHARSLANIAAELGTSATHIGRKARTAGIPLRPRGGHHIVSPDELDALPELLRPALADRRCWDRLRRFRQAMQHRTITEAAAHLGTRQAVLSNQILRLEKDLGVQLFIRPHRGESLRPTQAGHEVIAALAAFDEPDLGLRVPMQSRDAQHS